MLSAQPVLGGTACVEESPILGAQPVLGTQPVLGGTACVGEPQPAAVGFRLLFPAVGINNTCWQSSSCIDGNEP